MGILATYLQNALAQGQGSPPPSPFGGPPGGMPAPPNPFGGGFPPGVPNPFGVPSPGDITNTIGGWFSNPYGTHGSQPNPSPLNGINPYGTQVSGGNTNPWTPWNDPAYRPSDPNALPPGGWSFGGGNMGYQNEGMRPRPPNPTGTGDVAGPYAQQQHDLGAPGYRRPPPMLKPVEWQTPQQETGGHMGGGFGSGGPWGQQWLYQMNNQGPWQHVQQDSPYYGKGGT